MVCYHPKFVKSSYVLYSLFFSLHSDCIFSFPKNLASNGFNSPECFVFRTQFVIVQFQSMSALKIYLHCLMYVLFVHCFWLPYIVPCSQPSHSAYPFPQEKSPWLSVTCVFHSQCFHEDLYTCCLMELLCIKMCMYRGTWQHQLDGHEFEQTAGVDEQQGSLVCYSPWVLKESDMTEWLNWTCMCICVFVMAQQETCEDMGLIPGSDRSPGGGK